MVVLCESGESINPDVPKVHLENAVEIWVIENPDINTSGKSSPQLAEKLMEYFHHKTHATTRLKSEYRLNSPAYTFEPDDDGLVVYRVRLKVKTIQPILS